MSELLFGTVLITEGPHKGRIGFYDDDGFEVDESFEWDYEEDGDPDDVPGKEYAIVYLGFFAECQDYLEVPHEYLSPATTEDLRKRRAELRNKLRAWGLLEKELLDVYEFTELLWVENELYERMMDARYRESDVGKKIFVSHSSVDKEFVRKLCTDLSHFGHTPWLDEWEIKVGDSIPHKIETGLNDADFIVVVLSKSSIESKWVEREWHAKYWEELESGEIQVLPLLIEDCKIPSLLKMKKYANFSHDYNSGLDDVLAAVK